MAVLTLSREHQNGCVEIGKAVAEALNYEFIDKNNIYARLKRVGEKWGTLAFELDEEPPTVWEKFDWQYMGFISLIEAAIYEAALENRAVILGRGSAFILHDIPQVLKVRLHAPMKVRIERRMNQAMENYSTAQTYICKTDHSRQGYVQALYNKKLTDISHYDLIYNTAIQHYDQVSRDLIEILRNWDLNETPESRKQLEIRALAAKAKARIVTSHDIFIPTLEVFSDGHAIVVKGVVHNPMEYKLIRDIVAETVAPAPVRNELHYRK